MSDLEMLAAVAIGGFLLAIFAWRKRDEKRYTVLRTLAGVAAFIAFINFVFEFCSR